jgi:2-oxoglutarate ferredoxin oxidoreductase subunit gamma
MGPGAEAKQSRLFHAPGFGPEKLCGLLPVRDDLPGFSLNRDGGETVRREVRIAGFGGQGVVTLGTILAVAAGIHEKLEVAQTQSYGPEARGGACRSDVVISDEPIDYTKPMALDFFIALSPAAVEQYWPEVKEGKTMVLIDMTLVPSTPHHSPPILGLEATRIAEEEFKDRVVANMIMLGAMAAITDWVSLTALEETLNGRISSRSLEASRTALKRGFELGRKLKENHGGD